MIYTESLVAAHHVIGNTFLITGSLCGESTAGRETTSGFTSYDINHNNNNIRSETVIMTFVSSDVSIYLNEAKNHAKYPCSEVLVTYINGKFLIML